MAHPPGSAILALPYFATKGPNTSIDALMVLTNSYLASTSDKLSEHIVKFISSSSKISEPIEPNNSNIVVISWR